MKKAGDRDAIFAGADKMEALGCEGGGQTVLDGEPENIQAFC